MVSTGMEKGREQNIQVEAGIVELWPHRKVFVKLPSFPASCYSKCSSFADLQGPSFMQPYICTHQQFHIFHLRRDCASLCAGCFTGLPDLDRVDALALLERHQRLGLPIPTEAFLTVKMSQCGRGKKSTECYLLILSQKPLLEVTKQSCEPA